MKPFCYLSYRPKYSGYGYGTQSFVESFRKAGFRFSFRHDAHIIRKKVKEEIVIHSGFPHFFRLDHRKINIARVMLESDSLPRLWVDVLNTMDEVWVASKFNARTFSSAGVDRSRIFVVPDIIDTRLKRARKKKVGGSSGKFRFLSVFLDLSLRKGYDLMLSEFTKTFGGRKDVEWIVQCSGPSAKKLRSILNKMAEDGTATGNITLLGKRPTIAELSSLYATADCYVLPTRGEGFGRPYMEAAFCGLPIIATGFGGHLDFLNRRNSRLLNYRLAKLPVPEALDCYFLAGQRWAQPSGADLSQALGEALKKPALENVNLAPFEEERVIDLVRERIEKAEKKTGQIKKLAPQIIRYGKKWREDQPTPERLVSDLKKKASKAGIAGTGKNARQLSRFLLRNGFDIPFYIDRKEGRFLGKKVYAVDNLPASGLNAELLILSCFPAAFEEMKRKLENRFDVLPLIFYEAENGK